jgi:two-component system CheB/CheR fusion protein
MPHQSDDMTDETQPSAPPPDQNEEQPVEPSALQEQAAPETSVPPFPIVGIGASAGGLEAFEKFFTTMPADSGMAFVLVQHLDPTHNSMLVDIIRRYTRMQVLQVEDGMQVEPNTIYIIPPNRDMALMQRTLYLTKPEAARGLRLPIDFFFRSLADELQERAICIILSGTGTDGTLGMRAIKGEGGMAMVQSPASAKYDGMPQNALATGMIDFTLPPEEMPQQLMTYVQQEFVPGKPRAKPALSQASGALQKVFLALRSQTGHDFSQYKPSTTMRRIERRMTVNQIERIDDYVQYLQQNPLEVDTLFREMLIGVTNFFRDPNAFDALKQKVIPRLFTNRPLRQPVRVWVPGCSTGEEAYSLAIVLREHLNSIGQNYSIQVFATDIDSHAIEKARAGVYPDSIAADVSSERLQQFFLHEGNSFRVVQTVREMVIFAVQNVIKDPPFSGIDLMSCRNLLIYMTSDLQQRVIPLFHYALNPGGFLFLGTSETPSESSRRFEVIDRRWSLFQRPTDDTTSGLPAGFTRPEQHQPTPRETQPPQSKRSLRELGEQALLKAFAPVAVMINEQGDILYFHGKAGKYLEHASGEASLNLFHMARDGLHIVLPTMVREALKQQTATMREGIELKDAHEPQFVNVRVIPIERDVLLVSFEDVPISEPDTSEEAALDSSSEQEKRIQALQHELQSTREYLQTTIEELQSSNEEVQSSNEELQSSNEELQSTNEELETSKEELQSVNEELVTVNTELRNKIEQLTQANNDLKNLLVSMEVGTIFLDKQLHIRRFTPAAQQVVNVRDHDVGRPLNHLTATVVGVDLVQVAEGVLADLQMREQEVQNQEGAWFLLRARPYRTLENVVEGVVLTFADITQQKQVQADIYRQQQMHEAIFTQIDVPLFVLEVGEDGDFYYVDVNPADERLSGYDRDMLIGRRNDDLEPPLNPDHVEQARAYYRQCVEQGEPMTYEQQMDMPGSGREEWWTVQLTPLKDTAGHVYQIVGAAQRITERVKVRATLQRLSALVAQLPEWHQTIRQEHDELTMAAAFCRLLTRIDGYHIVRIGLRPADQPEQPPAQWAEQRAEEVPTADDVALDDVGAHQLAQAVREAREPVMIDDIRADPAYAAWHEAARACGFRAVIGLPLAWHAQPLGVLLVAAAAPDMFDHTTSAILNHLAATFAAGLAARRGLLSE